LRQGSIFNSYQNINILLLYARLDFRLAAYYLPKLQIKSFNSYHQILFYF
jgi:hypothetical protein